MTLQQQPGIAPGASATSLNNAIAVSSDGNKSTYYFAMNDITLATSALTDFFVLQGSATQTGRVKRITIWGESTAAGSIGVNLLRRSTAGAGGTSVVVPSAKLDNKDDTSTFVANYLTANYSSLGTQVGGIVRTGLLTFGNNGAAPNNKLEFVFADKNDKAAILRGTADFFCISGASASGETPPAGAKAYVEIECEGDNS